MDSPADNAAEGGIDGATDRARGPASPSSTEGVLGLEIEGRRFAVSADDPRDLAWLAEFLAPAFRTDVADDTDTAAGLAPAGCRVRLSASAARFGDLARALAGAPPREIEALGYDGRFSKHAGFTDEGGTTWAHGERWELFFGVGGEPDSAVVDVVARAPGPRARIALMRVVRELATAALTARGRLPLHAAAFEWDGLGVLVGGPKRAGKTTTLLHALRDGAAFLSNDRVFVDLDGPAGAPPPLTPMPTVVQLRAGTLDHHPDFAAALAAEPFDRAHTLEECAAGAADATRRARDGRPPALSPAQLCRLAHAPLRARAPLGLVLLPHIDPRAVGVTLEPLDEDTAVQALLGSLMKPGHPNRHSPLFAPRLADVVIDPADEAARCRRLAAAVPVMRCRLGPDATRMDLTEVLSLQAPRD